MTEPISPDSPLLQRLKVFEGDWKSTIMHPLQPDMPIQGQSRFEWFNSDLFGGDYFLTHRSQMDNPIFPRGLFIIAVDNDRENYAAHYFDSRGIARLYHMTFDGTTWKLWRDDPDFAQRYTGTLSADGKTITGAWEIAEDRKTWKHDFDLNYQKG